MGPARIQAPRRGDVNGPGPTRRGFLNLVGRAGGAAAVYHTMAAMGLLAVPRAYAGPPVLPQASGVGVKVVVLGAGIAGMTAAYELRKACYNCTLLEARGRPGGRNWTIRGGDRIVERDATQSCAFDAADHLYFNAGPARLPQHHQAVLSYCREFGVPLEVMVNDNRAALFHSDAAFAGRPVVARQVINDGRGFLAELLAKAINRDALDGAVDAEDKERLLAFVRSFGALRPDNTYAGSGRAGLSTLPGAGATPGKLNAPLAFAELLKSEFWYYKMHFAEDFDFAATMLQPVGGMDRITAAFAARLADAIIYNAVVGEIRCSGAGARIVYRDAGGDERALAADYVVCTVPLPVLAAIPADFSADFSAAIRAAHYVKAAKVAFQSRRFWEEDQHIYGGISWTDREITQIWYPSSGFHRRDGILLGAYIWSDEIGEAFGRLAPAERIAVAIDSGEKLHPQYRGEVGRGISVCWGNVPYSEGAWAEWQRAERATVYARLIQPDGPFHLAGEHLSYLTGWQEGAVLSAHAAVAAIAERVRAKKG
jgi:monoamine oxidase